MSDTRTKDPECPRCDNGRLLCVCKEGLGLPGRMAELKDRLTDGDNDGR